MTKNRWNRGALAVLFAALSLALAPAASATLCSHDQEVDAQTLNVALTATKKVYRIGQTATFTAEVTRDLHDLQLAKAEGAVVHVFLRVDDVIVGGYGVTDVNGVTTVPVKLARYLPAGKADVTGSAHIGHVDQSCLGAGESSAPLKIPGMLTIKR